MVKTSLHESVTEILLTATEEEVGQFVPRSGHESLEAGTEELCKRSPDITIDVNHLVIEIYNQSYWMTVNKMHTLVSVSLCLSTHIISFMVHSVLIILVKQF